jgi:hypothetical protein
MVASNYRCSLSHSLPALHSGVLLKIEVVRWLYALPSTKLKVRIRPCSHFLEVGIRHFKNWLVSIRRIPAYTTTAALALQLPVKILGRKVHLELRSFIPVAMVVFV